MKNMNAMVFHFEGEDEDPADHCPACADEIHACDESC